MVIFHSNSYVNYVYQRVIRGWDDTKKHGGLLGDDGEMMGIYVSG
jgi:hypothetical protein